MEHPVDATFPTTHITRELIDEVLPTFIGEQWQVPPVYSAVKINGKRAYEYARKGKQDDIEIKPKLLVIDELELQHFNAETMQLTLRVVCSKGTYIRALARDIGERLESGAYLTSLRRTRVGDYTIDKCITIEQLQQMVAQGYLKQA
jgi:tRNA pseudouridine55 synthase